MPNAAPIVTIVQQIPEMIGGTGMPQNGADAPMPAMPTTSVAHGTTRGDRTGEPVGDTGFKRALFAASAVVTGLIRFSGAIGRFLR